MDLYTGTARMQITPPVGSYMAGYALREGPALGVHDDLYASAVVFSDGAEMVALVAVDNCSFDYESDAEMRGAIAHAIGLDPDRILINTSHTHAGPMTARRAYQPFEASYLGGLIVDLTALVRQAIFDLSSSALAVGSAPLEIGGNRRHKNEHGEIVLGENAGGLALPEVTVWWIQRDDPPDLVLFSTPVHGVSLSHENRLFSAEWMGAAVREIERSQPTLRAIFLQGCAGDQNPIGGPQGGEDAFARMEAIGKQTAVAVRYALRRARAVDALPLANIVRQAPLPLKEGGVWDHPVHGVRLGDAVLVGLSGEPFAEYARFGKSYSSAESTMMLGYCDGARGYLPTEAAFAEGGYEPEAYVWYTDGKALSPAIEGVLKQEISQILDDLMAADGGTE